MGRPALAVVVAPRPGEPEADAGGAADRRSLLARARAAAEARAGTVAVVERGADGAWWADVVALVAGHRPALGSGGVVVIHDTARALADAGVWDRVLEAMAGGAAAAVPALAVTDTVRDRSGVLVDRETLVECQTPRAYRADTLVAMAATGAGDDLDALAAAGVAVTVVEGSASATSIQTAAELEAVRARIGP